MRAVELYAASTGILPVPVPAVANIIAEYGIAVNQMDIKGEFITPTGAAVAAAVRTTDRLPDKYIIKNRYRCWETYIRKTKHFEGDDYRDRRRIRVWQKPIPAVKRQIIYI